MSESASFEVIIIGGSYAGLATALTLGRSLRSTLVIDSGKPCNRQTPHSQNFLTQDGQAPAEISRIAREQVERYPTVQFRDDYAISAQKTESGIEVDCISGQTFQAGKLVIATGLQDQMPDIPGFADCWGISVIHCPYCHGYEYRDRKTGIMNNGEAAFHMTSLVRNLTKDIVLFTNGEPDFDQDQIETFQQHEIRILSSPISEIIHSNGQLTQVVTESGERLELDAVYAGIPARQHSDIPDLLGCQLDEQGRIVIDEFHQTTVAGVYACGDNSSPFRAVSMAVSSGHKVGALINMELARQAF